MKRIPFLILFLLLLSFNRSFAQDARIYLETENAAIFKPGSAVTVSVFVDSLKPVNAFEAQLNYPIDLLEFAYFNTANSIIDFWQDSPKNLEDGLIKLQGGGINSFPESKGEIIKINFIVKKEGQASLVFKNAVFYLADGKGTPIKPIFSPIVLNISESAPVLFPQTGEDKTAPVISNFETVSNPIDNSNLVIFQVKDLESGIKGSYAMFKKWLAWGEWMPVSNPFSLNSGVWAYRLKTVDNSGNVAEKTVYIWKVLAIKLILFAVFIGFATLIWRILRLKLYTSA